MKKELTTLFTGRHCTVLPEIDSTNSYLARILRKELLPEGTAIRAINQIAGRGQAGTQWESESGKNILASFIFYPVFVNSRHVFDLNKAFALGIYDFVNDVVGDEVSIKWPNDIYIKKEKVAGILIENSMNASSLSNSILGIGINVNQIQFTGNVRATSFLIETGRIYDIDELFSMLCSFIEFRYLQLKRGDLKRINEDYHSALYLGGQWNWFESGSKKFKGCIRNIDDDGRLMMEVENGDLKSFNVKEIKFL